MSKENSGLFGASVGVLIGSSLLALASYALGYYNGDKIASEGFSRALDRLCLTGDTWTKVINRGKIKLILTGTSEHISKD